MNILKFSVLITIRLIYFLEYSIVVDGHKILMLPLTMSSHQLYFGKLGQGLSKLGHQVEMVSASCARIPRGLVGGNFSITTYDVKNNFSVFDDPITSAKYVEFALSKNRLFAWLDFFSWFSNNLMPSVDKECEYLLDNLNLMERIINKSHFEFVVLDVMAIDCYYEIVKTLNVPYAILSIPFLAWNFGIPRLPSFVPNYATDMTDKMTFIERLQTFVSEASILLSTKFLSRPNFKRSYMHYSENIGKDIFIEINKKADLHFFMEDLVIGYPKPIMPNVVVLGDIMAGDPGSDLPLDLESFLGKDEAILFSFGSYIQVLSEDIARKYCKAFQQLQNIKIIWKLDDTTICSKYFKNKFENLLILPWIPQNDLLADERIKLFITHGGLNGMMESIYHAKPVIVFPIAVDQQSQAGSAQAKQYGIKMDLKNLESDDLARNIKTILNESLYRNNAKLYSEILRNKPDTPAERTSYAINFVLKFGSQHLKSSSLELYWFQLFMFDICLCIFFGAFVLIVISTYSCYCLSKRMFCRKYKLKKL